MGTAIFIGSIWFTVIMPSTWTVIQLFFNNGNNVQRCHAAFCQWLMDQEKALEIEEIERLQCELQAQEDPVTLGRAPFAPSWMVVFNGPHLVNMMGAHLVR